MRSALGVLPLALLVSLLPLPAAAGTFTVSLPPDSAVTVGSPSGLVFNVTNRDADEGLSRITLRFPSGYGVRGGTAPLGWTVEPGPAGSLGGSAEVTFRTTDETKCTGALMKGASLVFGVEVAAPPSRSVTPDSLVSAQGEQSCAGIVLDSPTTLPSWDRLGIEATLVAGPPTLGVGGGVTVTLSVLNISTVELAGIITLLRPSGTGGVGQMEGPTPPTLTLVPGASGSVAWAARATLAGTLQFSAQAVSPRVASPSVRSDTLFVGDLEVSLSLTPEQVRTGQEVQTQMTVTNRGPIRVANVIPSRLASEGTAAAGAVSGPTPASQPVLEPGESVTFTWAATISGKPGESYAFSGWASAEWDAIVSASATSNRGAVAEEAVAGGPAEVGTGVALGGGRAGATASPGDSGQAAGVSGAGTSASSGGSPPLVSASVQLIGVNHGGSQTGGTQFWSGTLRDLRILVAWSNLSGTHTERLDLYAPDGALYQQSTSQFSGAGTVETRLPVGGTWITEHSLYGAWRVEVFLDAQGSPITSGVFVLNP